MNRVTVIDYGIGNIFSVCRALEACGAEVELSGEPSRLVAADRLVLPGVGAFAKGMHNLAERELIEPIHAFVARERPFLGICLGMQMMLDRSTEFGDHRGLGLIGGDVLKISDRTTDGRPLRVPHIGWSRLDHVSEGRAWSDTLFRDIAPGCAVYFVHSYAANPRSRADILAVTRHGGNEVVAAIAHNNVFGCQFHPERSGEVGMAMLRAFVAS